MMFNKLQKNVLCFAISYLIFLFGVGTFVLTIHNNQIARTQMLDNILDVDSVEDYKVLDTKLNLNINKSLNQLDNILDGSF